MTRTEEQHTAATRHPHWNNIVRDIENRFPTETVRAWCIRAVSAHLLGVQETAQHVMLCLGEALSSALIEICSNHEVDLASVSVAHVKS